MIQKAKESNITDIKDILYDAVRWMSENGIPNLWTFDNARWSELSKDYKIEDFYLYYLKDKPVGCMALTNEDKQYWPKTESGNAIFIHKLAVKREASGAGISKELINYAKKYAYINGINSIRLDCSAEREKLRMLYENEGFKYVKIITNKEKYSIALYEKNYRRFK